jgi:hypothetical protein
MIWTISDLHLSSVQPKPMDIFGAHWTNHAERIAAAWRERVSADDYVLVAGDISWALKLPEALPDLQWIGALPGHKVLIRGNHDYWYPRRGKPLRDLRARLPAGMTALSGDAVDIGAAVVCGTRGWITPDTTGFQPASDTRIYERELTLLDNALQEAHRLNQNGRPLIVMLHYPPFLEGQPTEFARRVAAAGAAACIYGHLHRPEDWATAVQGHVDGVDYQLTACDYLGFTPVAVRGLRR